MKYLRIQKIIFSITTFTLFFVAIFLLFEKSSHSIDQGTWQNFPCNVQTFEEYVQSPCYEMDITDEEIISYLNQEMDPDGPYFPSSLADCLNECAAKSLNYALDPLKRVVFAPCHASCFLNELELIQNNMVYF